jgi:hypothetical protein
MSFFPNGFPQTPEPKCSPFAKSNDQPKILDMPQYSMLETSPKHIWIDESISTVASSGTTQDTDSSPRDLDFLFATINDEIDDTV